MKIIVLKDCGGDFKERCIIEAKDLNAGIRRLLRNVDLSKKSIATCEGNEQIRIPEKVFEQIQPEVQKALRKIAEEPSPKNSTAERWLKENYWANCKAYIFNFRGTTVDVGVEWGYEGIERSDYTLFIMEQKHPFLAEFLGCSEGLWGKFGEKENIQKWLVQDSVIQS